MEGGSQVIISPGWALRGGSNRMCDAVAQQSRSIDNSDDRSAVVRQYAATVASLHVVATIVRVVCSGQWTLDWTAGRCQQ